MKTPCIFCKREIESSMSFCPHCGKEANNQMVEVLFKSLGAENYYKKVREMNKNEILIFQDSISIHKFWNIFVLPLIDSVCLEQRRLVQKYYEKEMGECFEDAPFNFTNDVESPDFNTNN